jgi:hypothetical protein
MLHKRIFVILLSYTLPISLGEGKMRKIGEDIMHSVFGDLRLDKRLQRMKMAIRQQINVSLPQMMQTWSNLKAAYRFFK